MKANFHPATRAEEIEQNVKCIIDTVLGTVPLFRNFGLDTPQDVPVPFLESQLAIRVTEAIQECEPRVEVTKVIVKTGENGKAFPLVDYNIVEEGKDVGTE
ncbi:GPW/gp25 family protein [Paenibacillus alvei]|uniref:GPW/gp25 family protein n=1 Tax=Paenibacillus alvei TaxID=44250 RepID=UPI000289CD5D|nr:GPW/gp25 family protein [Paenibacillus alvei]EJW16895.1 phage baseplate assembly protein W [Paenibacillus alvei DSM 29]EJW19892.1 phage baseplate assembly protein W [Paenibacillus alvei DSM 29]MCY9543284.1 GPW/gp25 family protein [Paenibacillus alvei]MCY9708459.1 GPW/gp25 family protein [Paenibacillus alvei]MCY9732182.1 GPW/gp25 family protein [Paenibacillus alvei]